MNSKPDTLPTCLLVDDHPALRAGVKLSLELAGSATVVGEAGNGAQALSSLVEHAPDVALVDMRLGQGMTGIDVVSAARERGVTTKLVLLTGLSDPGLVSKALAAGADGYVAKDSPTSIIQDAIAAVLSGKRYIDPTLVAAVMDHGNAGDSLSGREMQVLQLMAQGKQNKVIAQELQVSTETVKSFVSAILRKLDAHGRTEAVVTAMRRHMIDS